MGIEATGKTTTVAGVTIDRLADGKVAEAWAHWDTMGLMQQLGVIPELARAQRIRRGSEKIGAVPRGAPSPGRGRVTRGSRSAPVGSMEVSWGS